jgi:hypothetical protein
MAVRGHNALTAMEESANSPAIPSTHIDIPSKMISSSNFQEWQKMNDECDDQMHNTTSAPYLAIVYAQ